jgi:hypothetical protein
MPPRKALSLGLCITTPPCTAAILVSPKSLMLRPEVLNRSATSTVSLRMVAAV